MNEPSPDRRKVEGDVLLCSRRCAYIGMIAIAALLRFGAACAARPLQRTAPSIELIVAREFVWFARLAGGAWVKLGQLLGTRRDLFSDEAIGALAALRNRVGGRAPRNVAKLVSSEVQARGGALRRLSESSIASGSIAFIYAGEVSGIAEPVVLKVLRPNIRQVYLADCALLNAAARFLSRLPALRHVPLRAIALSVSQSLIDQADLIREAMVTCEFRERYAKPGIATFPFVYGDLSTRRILVMRRETGLASIDARNANYSKASFVHLLQTIFAMLFVHGRLHCDIHPGNVFFRQPDECVFLDCGLSVQLDESQRWTLSDFFLCIALDRGQRAADLLMLTAVSVPDRLDRAQFDRAVATLISEFSGLPARDFSMVRLVSKLFAIMRTHHVVCSPDFIWMVTILSVIEVPVKLGCPELDFQRIAVDVITEARFESIT